MCPDECPSEVYCDPSIFTIPKNVDKIDYPHV